MPGASFVAVFAGAGAGALIRWWLGLALNAVFPTIPLGTLIANLLGGYLIGIASALFTLKASLPPEARLFVITGFLGGLTTFSTFSNEIVSLHMLGSFALTAAGLLTARWLLLGHWAFA